ncbi:DUF3617 domain-containing protein [Sphingomonas sp.]|jgi:hypothetical protein|uniref:DUF3617 domain-containing protein n=1 Tax=Sphingomonas sp. TaxID=28214 RepID=UPI002D7E239D|nr:DUF3617 family protein [Sphingomonas sp.]HEU0045128.1 DUF3617 family protein [Sphingomonas sp.]
MRLLIALPLLLAAASPAGFTPGLWQVTSAPGTATLGGRSLGDLPYDAPATPGEVCLSAADAANGAWLARDLGPGCTLTSRKLVKGRIDLAGTCAPQAPGLARGTVRITGRWTTTSYDLRFTTRNPSENGVMGFTGTMSGKRIGACPV